MSSPYIGECRLVGFNFAPVGWAMCQGQLVPISENDTLFQLLGTTYGGDGQNTFGLPDLQGRVPIHQGQGVAGTTYVPGEKGGVEQVTLTIQQIPKHTHTLIASNTAGNSSVVQQHVLANAPSGQVYVVNGIVADTPLNANALMPQGGNQPHDHLQPFLTMKWIISLFGIFPTQN